MASRLLALVLVLVMGLLGCGATRSVPELLTLTDITPRTFTANDRVDISGRDLPIGQVTEAVVVLKGDLHRPGQAPLLDQTIEITDARLERDRVTFDIDDRLLERLTGRGDTAKHTTFRGTVGVRLPNAKGALPVMGSLKGEITLDVLPREQPSKKAREEAEARTKDAQAFFGWSLEEADAARGGLRIVSVRPDSPAARAGLREGDVVVAFGGLSALSPSDAVPNGLDTKAPLTILRGDQSIDAALDMQGFRGDPVAGLTEGVVILASLAMILLVFGTRLGRGLSWVAHRLKEELSRHRLPDDSFVITLLRAAVQDARRVTRGSGATDPSSPISNAFTALAPVLVATGVSLSFGSLPFVELQGRIELDVGILYLVSVTALLAMGLVTGGWGSVSSAIGGRLRAVLEVIVCELPAASALGAVVVMTGSLHVRDVVLSQVGSGGSILETGGWPWAWNALKSPQLFLLFGLFFVTALVDGSPTTSTSKRSGAIGFFFAEWTHVFVMCGLGTIAFLGGYALPGVAIHELYASPWLKALGCLVFLAKCWTLAFVVLVVRGALPRVRPHLVLRFGLRTLLPACVVALAVTALAVRFPLLPSIERGLGLVTLATAATAVLVVVGSVYGAFRAQSADRLAVGSARSDAFAGRLGLRGPTRVNPFL